MSSKPCDGDQPNGSRCHARVTESPGSTWLSGKDCAPVIGAALGLKTGRQKGGGLAKQPGGSRRIRTRSMGALEVQQLATRGQRAREPTPCGRLPGLPVAAEDIATANPVAAGVVNKAGPGSLVEASLSVACVAARFGATRVSRCLKMETALDIWMTRTWSRQQQTPSGLSTAHVQPLRLLDSAGSCWRAGTLEADHITHNIEQGR